MDELAEAVTAAGYNDQSLLLISIASVAGNNSLLPLLDDCAIPDKRECPSGLLRAS